MRLKPLARFVSLALCGSMLAACGGSDSDNSSGGNDDGFVAGSCSVQDQKAQFLEYM